MHMHTHVYRNTATHTCTHKHTRTHSPTETQSHTDTHTPLSPSSTLSPPTEFRLYGKLIGSDPPTASIPARLAVHAGGPDTLCCSSRSPPITGLLHLSGRPRRACSKTGADRPVGLREKVTDTLPFVSALSFSPSLRLSPSPHPLHRFIFSSVWQPHQRFSSSISAL